MMVTSDDFVYDLNKYDLEINSDASDFNNLRWNNKMIW